MQISIGDKAPEVPLRSFYLDGVLKSYNKFQIGTNVLKIAVYIYTNNMSYAIIRVAFVLSGPF